MTRLEHIEEDEQVLLWLSAAVRTGCRLVFLVPFNPGRDYAPVRASTKATSHLLEFECRMDLEPEKLPG